LLQSRAFRKNLLSRIARQSSLRPLFDSIDEQLAMVCGDEEQVKTDCESLRELLTVPPSPGQMKLLSELTNLLAGTDDSIAAPVFHLLTDLLPSLDKPWPLMKGLLRSAEESLAGEAAALALRWVDEGKLTLGRPLLNEFARLLDRDFSPFEDEDLLQELISGVRNNYRKDQSDGLLILLRRDPDDRMRSLAARLLDHGTPSVDPAVARQVLGAGAYKVLAPYLEYTRATYGDLNTLCAGKRIPRRVLKRFREAAHRHGEALIREAVAELGWSRVNLGLIIEHLVEVKLPGALPLLVRPDEALLFSGTSAVRGQHSYLITAHGGCAPGLTQSRTKSDPVDRFRQLNIVHAELLGEILDVVPLGIDKVRRVIGNMDTVVEIFTALFAESSPDCAVLPGLWQDMRGEVFAKLSAESEFGPLSGALTRLMLAFEDPANLGEVRTVHGLKRYLHQRGLKLGFEMVETNHAPNRTVDLLLKSEDGTLTRPHTLRYAEFETGTEVDADRFLPHAVQIALAGVARQMLYGTRTFPSIDVFIFGNEVHYYLAFRNHPAFLRVDFSPPQRGGMMDLEYYGVSSYELDLHPNLQLEAIRRIFRELHFDVQLEGNRLFVRYDKERSNSLGDLNHHVAALFRLSPYLMEVDWAIGNLDLPAPAKQAVAAAWAQRFARSGVLPLDRILNEKRSGILVDEVYGPTGREEILWDGLGEYRDILSHRPPPGLFKSLNMSLGRLGIHAPAWAEDVTNDLLPLLAVESSVIDPVREALDQGRLEVKNETLELVSEDLFRVIHEAEFFAGLLAFEGSDFAAACQLARPLAELEKFVDFTPSGFVGGLVVARARVAALGGCLNAFVLRDGHGVIHLGVVSPTRSLTASRRVKNQPWKENARLDDEGLWLLLRSANYLAASQPAAVPSPARDLADLRAQAALNRPADNRRFQEKERILTGLRASPGRSVGRALFGTEGRQPSDLDGHILVASQVRPTDNQFLFRSAGIVSTGGAVLSHAALLAIQFGKPAMVVEAHWHQEHGRVRLQFSVPEYRESEKEIHGFVVGEREVLRRRNLELVEGDLIILDADEGVVQIIGQDRDTLALWEGLRLLGEACARAENARTDHEFMEIRAAQLRARHQIQKILDRMEDRVLAAFAVEELLVGATVSKVPMPDKVQLLARLLDNRQVASAGQFRLKEICCQLADHCSTAQRTAGERIPTSGFLYEILGLRLRALHHHKALSDVSGLLKKVGSGQERPDCPAPIELDELARDRLEGLRLELLTHLPEAGARSRHLQRRIGRIGRVLGTPMPRPDVFLECQEHWAGIDRTRLAAGGSQLIQSADECGMESSPCVGWKAVNLAEIDRLAGAESVPPWFVVTNFAFDRILNQPVGSPDYLGAGAPTLGDAIKGVLGRKDLDNREKSRAIKGLWSEMSIPEDLRREVTVAHARLVGDHDPEPFVALRSSSSDEDTETVMRAGEFESYLFIRGVESLLQHLLLTWSGLWTERALYSREAAGDVGQPPAGGVIVQRMIRSRVSGVLQTVNVARGDLRELLINAVLGLGEGIVSGVAAADLITVVKDFGPGENPSRLNYLTSDKPEQVVFDDRRGWGTRLEETLYHQRLRPALEYFELCEVVAKAAALEAGYGYPLDIEFAIEGSRLWLLQARPIATFGAELRQTLSLYPLTTGVPTNRES
jgi:phosphohistidine swiveling domain-containing protein